MSDDKQDERSEKAERPFTDAEKKLLGEAAAHAERLAPVIGAAQRIAEQNRPIIEAAQHVAQMNRRPIAEAAAAIAAAHTVDFRSLAASLAATLPKMDDVIRQSAISAADLRALLPVTERFPTMDLETTPMPPLKSATEYAVDRVERAVDRLTEVAAKTAEMTAANGELAKAQTTALAAGLHALHATTREAISAGEARDRAAAKRESVLVGLTWALVFLAIVTVVVGAIPLARDIWRETESLRSFGALVLWLVNQIIP